MQDMCYICLQWGPEKGTHLKSPTKTQVATPIPENY